MVDDFGYRYLASTRKLVLLFSNDPRLLFSHDNHNRIIIIIQSKLLAKYYFKKN